MTNKLKIRVIFLQALCKCKFGCKEIAASGQKRKLYELYHTKNMTLSRQMTYLLSLIQVMPVSRRRHGTYDDPSHSRRQHTLVFVLPDTSGSFVQVCRKMFMETFRISHQTVETLGKLRKQGELTYVEKRGGARTVKYREADRKLVHDHINSFPKDVSHYTRTRTGKREFLSTDLSVSKMYEAFLIAHPDQTHIKHRYYWSIWRTDFPNLSFRPPRMDTCKDCDRLKIRAQQRNEEGRQAKSALEEHHRIVEESLHQIQQDFTSSTLPNSTATTLTMDLQKVFLLPKLTHSSMYYARQLSCYNFGIHIADSNGAVMCIWDESYAGRGANEMASCLFHALNDGLIGISKRHLIIFSDNCAGQLKNQMFIMLYIFLISLNLFDTIDHKFLVSGHSFSASDRDFALIELASKRSKLQTPTDVHRVIKSARKLRPFTVLDITEKPIFDFSSKAKTLLNTTKLQISKQCWIRVTERDLTVVQTKTSFDPDADFMVCKIAKKGLTSKDMAEQVRLLQATKEKTEIDKAKLKDIHSMLPYLQPEAEQFYRSLLQQQGYNIE